MKNPDTDQPVYHLSSQTLSCRLAPSMSSCAQHSYCTTLAMHIASHTLQSNAPLYAFIEICSTTPGLQLSPTQPLDMKDSTHTHCTSTIVRWKYHLAVHCRKTLVMHKESPHNTRTVVVCISPQVTSHLPPLQIRHRRSKEIIVQPFWAWDLRTCDRSHYD